MLSDRQTEGNRPPSQQIRGYFTSVASEMCRCVCRTRSCVCVALEVVSVWFKTAARGPRSTRRAAKCKSISMKIRSIVQYSHTTPPKMGFFGCTEKDVIRGKPLKQGDFGAPIKKFLAGEKKPGRFGHTPPFRTPPPEVQFFAKVPVLGGVAALSGWFLGLTPLFQPVFAFWGIFQADFHHRPPVCWCFVRVRGVCRKTGIKICW